MKTYTGSRTIDGIRVLVDGEPLDERYELKKFTKNGFEWTYEGAEPSQLALRYWPIIWAMVPRPLVFATRSCALSSRTWRTIGS